MAIPQLAEHDLTVEGVPVHCWEGGTAPAAVVLLHGSGPGASTLSNFRRVLGPLTGDFHVLAADLIGFGRSGLRAAEPFFDMDLWVRQLQALLDYLDRDDVIVVGHSLSGPIALKAAGIDRRIAGVLTTGTMGVVPDNPARGPRWRFPENEAELRGSVERTFYDKTLAEEEELARRREVLGRPGYRDYLQRMFAGPAIDYVRASALSAEELARVRCPVLLMHGLQDGSFSPRESSLALAENLARADVCVLCECGHSVAHERPREFLAGVHSLSLRIADMASHRATQGQPAVRDQLSG
jgi:2-hydroxymuconate-semialdehyde hydrolase